MKQTLARMKTNLETRKSKKGFTLVELVIVIAILAIIAAVAIPTVLNVTNNAKAGVDAANAQAIELAIKSTHSMASGAVTDIQIGTQHFGPGQAGVIGNIKISEALTYSGLDIATITKTQTSGNSFYVSTDGKAKVTVASSGGTGNGLELTDLDKTFANIGLS